MRRYLAIDARSLALSVASPELRVVSTRVISRREVVIDPKRESVRRPEVLVARNCEPARGKGHAP